MSGGTSLTEAVKAAATKSSSLTDAVKEAARSGTDCTIISFPRSATGPRHDAPVPAFGPRGLTEPGPDHLGDALETAPEPGVPAHLEDIRPGPVPTLRKPRLRHHSRRFRSLHRARRASRALVDTAKRAGQRVRQRLWALATAVKLASIRMAAIALLASASLVATPSPVGSDRPMPGAMGKRVALVVGNSAYRYARRLDNPKNDAVDIGAALKRLGFQVVEGFDLDKAALDRKIREFTGVLRGADVGVFFYAGHGLHVSGNNYLVPIDAELTGAGSLDVELVRLDMVHRTMEREAQTNILFFDACRDNPLSDNLARAMGTRSLEIGRGLAIVHGGAGTLISFSTQPGTLALDGKGRNSPYSAALARQLAASHEDLGTMLIAIRNDVMKETGRKQVPWEHSALTGRFYFNHAAELGERAAAPTSRAREAFDAWSAAKDTRSAAVLDAFIARYADTFYAELARARKVDLRRQATATATLPWVAELAPSTDTKKP
jgi:uncharacterized caspase-like protein